MRNLVCQPHGIRTEFLLLRHTIFPTAIQTASAAQKQKLTFSAELAIHLD